MKEMRELLWGWGRAAKDMLQEVCVSGSETVRGV